MSANWKKTVMEWADLLDFGREVDFTRLTRKSTSSHMEEALHTLTEDWNRAMLRTLTTAILNLENRKGEFDPHLGGGESLIQEMKKTVDAMQKRTDRQANLQSVRDKTLDALLLR